MSITLKTSDSFVNAEVSSIRLGNNSSGDGVGLFIIEYIMRTQDGDFWDKSVVLSDQEIKNLTLAADKFTYMQLFEFTEVYLIKKGYIDADLASYSSGVKAFVDKIIA